jgi:hypothetical protein
MSCDIHFFAIEYDELFEDHLELFPPQSWNWPILGESPSFSVANDIQGHNMNTRVPTAGRSLLPDLLN